MKRTFPTNEWHLQNRVGGFDVHTERTAGYWCPQMRKAAVSTQLFEPLKTDKIFAISRGARRTNSIAVSPNLHTGACELFLLLTVSSVFDFDHDLLNCSRKAMEMRVGSCTQTQDTPSKTEGMARRTALA